MCDDAGMTSAVSNITFDCADPYELALFWRGVVGFPLGDDDHPGDPEIGLVPPEGHPMLLFIRVGYNHYLKKVGMRWLRAK